MPVSKEDMLKTSQLGLGNIEVLHLKTVPLNHVQQK